MRHRGGMIILLGVHAFSTEGVQSWGEGENAWQYQLTVIIPVAVVEPLLECQGNPRTYEVVLTCIHDITSHGPRHYFDVQCTCYEKWTRPTGAQRSQRKLTSRGGITDPRKPRYEYLVLLELIFARRRR